MYVTIPIVRPGADAQLILHIFSEADATVCGLRWLKGRIALGPKAMRRAICEELEKIERIARDAGCTEMRHSGDDRGWCLPGYEPMPELPNGRRKRL